MKKTLLAFMLITAILCTNSLVFAGSKAADTKFTDISGHWAEQAINRVVDTDDFAGTDGKFLPDKAIKRSEFVLMLHKALGINIAYFKATDINEYYDDVKNEDAYASNLYDLVTTGIIDDKEHFNPDRNLTREEMVNYIMNAYRYKLGNNYRMINIVVKPFADDAEINPSYSGSIARADNMGIIVRPSNNRFYPKKDGTRAQAATVIDRLLSQLEKENMQVDIKPSVELKDGSMKMKLTITNNSKSQVVIKHSSGQKYDFKLLDSERNVLYTWSADKMFTMMVSQTIIEPGKSVEFSGDVEKSVLDGIKGKVAYMNAYLNGETDSFAINPNGYEIEVK